MKLRLTGGYDYGSGDGTAESYCFDDWGYLYVNTVTPDGYQVNELGACGYRMGRYMIMETTWEAMACPDFTGWRSAGSRTDVFRFWGI